MAEKKAPGSPSATVNEKKETPLPLSGGSWRQDPLTGELVKVVEQQDNQAVEPAKENE